MTSVSKKVILITGASSGFGEGATRALLSQGHIVYAAARRTDRMAELEQQGATLLAMDVTKNETILDGVHRIIEEQQRIDVVVANAGFGAYGAIEAVPMDQVLYQYDVNVFGVGRTVQATLPHMRKRRQGRIIITSSLASHLSAAAMGWYSSTKHAIKGVAEALRQETRSLGIDVVLIEPGIVKTEFDSVALGALDKLDHPDDYRELIRGVHRRLADSYAAGPGPESTVAAIVRAVNARKPKTRYRTTLDAKVLPLVRTIVSDRQFDAIFLGQVRAAASKK